MTLAFTLESIALCDAVGHRWRHVRAWHDVGWHECRTCHQTAFTAPTAFVPPVAPPEQEVSDGPETLAAPARPRSHHPKPAPVGTRKRGELVTKRARNAAVLARIAEGVQGIDIAAEFGITPARVSQIGRVLLEVHRNTKSERNDAVLEMLTAGSSPSDVARHFGLTSSRIAQIVRHHAPEGFVMPPMLGAERRAALDERNADIRRRKLAGEKPKDIAAALGVCLSVVHKLRVEEVNTAKAQL